MNDLELQLYALMQEIEKIHPELSGRFVKKEDELFIYGSAETDYYIAKIYDYLQNTFPQAGKIYWSTVTWETLIWQPIYLSVLSVHFLAKAVCLENFALRIGTDSIKGYVLGKYPIFEAKEEELISFSGEQINSLCNMIYNSLVKVSPFSFKIAQKLQSDRIAFALSFYNKRSYLLKQQEMDIYINKWLSASSLPTKTSYTFKLNGRNPYKNFEINRQSCCQDFRVNGGEYCDNCLLIPIERRIELLSND